MTMDPVTQVVEAAMNKNIMLATAESCTGGMIAAALTEISGSSAAFDRGFVTYSNEAKHEMLGVPTELINDHGAVSAEVAAAMAAGALTRSNASLVVAVTGVAGPTGGSPEKPVGLVWFGIARTGAVARSDKRLFENKGREFIRKETVMTALHMMKAELDA